MSIKLTSDQMYDIFIDCEIQDFEYEQVHQSEWVNEGKFDSCDVVFSKDGKHYMFCVLRYGDYWKGYEFEFYDNEAVEVKKVEVIVKKWVQVEGE